ALLDLPAQGVETTRRLRARRRGGTKGERKSDERRRAWTSHHFDSSSEPSNRCNPYAASAPIVIRSVPPSDTCRVVKRPAAFRPSVPTMLQRLAPTLSDIAAATNAFM